MYRRCGFRHEKKLRAVGIARIAGVDEAGRGALAGPVVAAAVILPEKFRHRKLKDSKQLSPDLREAIYAELHLTRLHELGPCPIHRRSFEPVAQPLLALELIASAGTSSARIAGGDGGMPISAEAALQDPVPQL